MVDEETLKTFTFGDIETNESYAPDTTIFPGLQLEILETGKRGRGNEQTPDESKKKINAM
jgi:hypothetical protein